MRRWWRWRPGPVTCLLARAGSSGGKQRAQQGGFDQQRFRRVTCKANFPFVHATPLREVELQNLEARSDQLSRLAFRVPRYGLAGRPSRPPSGPI